MSTEITVVVHAIAQDGVPDMTDDQVGRIAFIWDGAVISGWPLNGEHVTGGPRPLDHWEPSEDRFGGAVTGVTHWLEFPAACWDIERNETPTAR